MEGILDAGRYGAMLARLRADHRGPTYGYYLDLSFAETLARHATRPIAGEFGEEQWRTAVTHFRVSAGARRGAKPQEEGAFRA